MGIPSGRVRRKRMALLVSGIMSVVVLLASGTAWAVSGWVSGQLNRSDVFGALTDEERPDAGPSGAQTILVLGSDSRGEAGDTQGGEARDARSDTMMLVRLHGDREHVTVVGVPRDSWVDIPGHGPDKINAAYALGGPPLAIQTVESTTGVRVDHYVEIDFAGFVDVVDALGGVEVCLPEAIYDDKAHLAMEAGTHEVNGTEALAFARTRQSADGDLDRIDRQQQVLAALLDKALSTNTVSDPAKFTSFLDAALSSATVDEGLDTGTIRQLGDQLSSIGLDDVTFTQVPIGQMDFRTPDGESAVAWERAEADALFARLRDDEHVGEAPAEPSPDGDDDGIAPSEVTLEVYNGVGTPGLGAQVRAALLGAGYDIPDAAGNWTRSDVQDTVVRYAPEQAEAAQEVVGIIPGAEAEEDESLSEEIQVVIGFNYSSVDAPASPGSDEPEEDAEEGPAARDSVTTTSARDNLCE